MKKLLSKLIFAILFAFPISVFAAGSISVSPSSLTIQQGSSKTFTISAYNTIGDVSISSNNSGIASVSTREWGTGMVDEGQKKSGTITVYGNSIGTTTITLRIDAATFDGEDLAGQTRTVTVNVVAKPTPQPQPQPQPQNPGNNNNNNNNKNNNLSKNNNLKEISIDGYELVKVGNNNYTVTVGNNVSSINVKATAEDSKAKVDGTGSKELVIGENNIEVIITSESGAKNKILLKVTRKDAYYLEDLDDALKDTSTQIVDVIINEDSKLTSEHLNKIKQSKRAVNFNLIDENKKVIYSWTIDGNKINTSKDMLTTVAFTSENSKEIGELTNYAYGVNVNISKNGEIPSGTKLKLYVGDKYSNGDIVNIYSYDKQNNKLTLVKNNISVKDEYLEFDVDKNIEYFITKADLSRLNQNVASSFNIFAILSIIELAVIILGVAIYFIKIKSNMTSNKDNSNIISSTSENTFNTVNSTNTNNDNNGFNNINY